MDAYEGLNEGQRRAVAHEGGPLLVLAGPGTGKTRVITHRIARILEGGAAPESVLAVTFTIKAATEMRGRLSDLAGVSASERVRAGTIHSFGLRLLQRFADLAGIAHEPELIDSAQRRRLLREAIAVEDVPARHAAGGWAALIDYAQGWIGRFRNGALFPEDVAGAIAARRAHLEANPEGLDATALAGERASLERLELASRLYTRFDAMCRERGWLTLDDLIARPIELLRRESRVRDIVRADLRHIVVDEFQDVNGAQIELLRAIAPPESGPDLCVVGDDDQAIYMFRGADDLALSHFSRIWAGHETVELSENYRSDGPVLAVADAVIRRAGSRYAPEKTVRVAEVRGREAYADARVECVHVERESDDPGVVVSLLLAARAAAPDRPWSDYAVIGRGHLDLERIGAALRIEGIPFEASRQSGAAEDEGVMDVLAWVRLLVEPEDATAPMRVLTRPPLSVPVDEVAACLRDHRVARSRGDERSLASFIAETRGSHPGFGRFLALREELAGVALGVRADAAISAIIARTDPAHAELLAPDRLARRMESLVALMRFAADKAPRLEEPADLGAFWSYYQDLDGREQGLEIVGREAVDEDREAREASGVQLLTAFVAKGLEFDTVIVPRVTPPNGYPNTRSRGDEEVPGWMARFDRGGRSLSERHLDEERRIFYVACTRAIRRLVLLSPRRKGRSSSTHFFQELVHDEPALVSVVDAGALVDDVHGTEREAVALGLADPARDVVERARREARAEAARALHEADRAGLTEEELASIGDRLRGAAARMGVAAALDAGRGVPGWVAGEGAAWAEDLSGRVEAMRGGRPAGRPSFRGLAAPLSLSYTAIDSYLRCPMCFYLRTVLGLDEPMSEHLLLGSAAHRTLQWFYERHRLADAEGGARPGRAEALARASEELRSVAGPRREVPPALDAQLRAQIELTLDRLDDPGLEVLAVEQLVDFPYEHAGVAHRMRARLDRIDRLGDGGFRIVDYKTGGARKALLEPGAGDLQLAIYAMALAHLYPGSGEVPPGVAEYWVLGAGERGGIGLEALDLEKTRARIGEAIEGMLAGRFDASPRCEGPCTTILHASQLGASGHV